MFQGLRLKVSQVVFDRIGEISDAAGVRQHNPMLAGKVLAQEFSQIFRDLSILELLIRLRFGARDQVFHVRGLFATVVFTGTNAIKRNHDRALGIPIIGLGADFQISAKLSLRRWGQSGTAPLL